MTVTQVDRGVAAIQRLRLTVDCPSDEEVVAAVLRTLHRDALTHDTEAHTRAAINRTNRGDHP